MPAGLEPIALTRGDLNVCDAGAVLAAFRRLEPEVVVNAAAYTDAHRHRTVPSGQAAKCRLDTTAATAGVTYQLSVRVVLGNGREVHRGIRLLVA